MSRLESVANMATVLIAGIGVYLVVSVSGRATPTSPGEPMSQPDLVGRKVTALKVLPLGEAYPESEVIEGRPTILYVFATTCMFCEAQKEFLAEFLTSAEDVRVLTASRESPAVVAKYWGDRELPTLSLSNESATKIGNIAVPMLYLIDASGTIKRAFLGSMLSWPMERLRQEVASTLFE